MKPMAAGKAATTDPSMMMSVLRIVLVLFIVSAVF
jgi:hypothetical protein